MMKKSVSFGSVLLMVLVLAGLMTGESPETQPIAYNHYLHVEENAMECRDCHMYAEDNARASIPNIEVCRDCHEDAMSDKEAEVTLINYITENTRIPWKQIYSVPDHAYFSHRRHVKLGELDCTVCHGEVGKLSTPVTEPYVEVTMDWCMDCHESSGISIDCSACHR